MTDLPEPDGALEIDCGPYPNGPGRLVECVDGYTADTVRRLIAAEVERLTRERQAYKDAAGYAAKERDALRIAVEKLEAEVFDLTSMYNRCVEDVHAARDELAECKAVMRVALEFCEAYSVGALSRNNAQQLASEVVTALQDKVGKT